GRVQGRGGSPTRGCNRLASPQPNLRGTRSNEGSGRRSRSGAAAEGYGKEMTEGMALAMASDGSERFVRAHILNREAERTVRCSISVWPSALGRKRWGAPAILGRRAAATSSARRPI